MRIASTSTSSERGHDLGHNWPKVRECEVQLVSLGYGIPCGNGPIANPAYHIIIPDFPESRRERAEQAREFQHLEDMDSGSSIWTRRWVEGSEEDWKESGTDDDDGFESESSEEIDPETKIVYGIEENVVGHSR